MTAYLCNQNTKIIHIVDATGAASCGSTIIHKEQGWFLREMLDTSGLTVCRLCQRKDDDQFDRRAMDRKTKELAKLRQWNKAVKA